MNIYLVLIILFVHWFADFVMQTDEDAKGKSSDNWCLTTHVLSYTLCFFIPFALFCAYQNHFGHLTPSHFGIDGRILLFFPITFIFHWITDYFISRLNSRLWEAKQTHNFFVSVGFDQFLHFVQLLLTFKFLS